MLRSTTSSIINNNRNRNDYNNNNNDNNNNNNNNNDNNKNNNNNNNNNIDNNDNNNNKNDDNNDNSSDGNGYDYHDYHHDNGESDTSNEIRNYSTNHSEKRIKKEMIHDLPEDDNIIKKTESAEKNRKNKLGKNKDESENEKVGYNDDWCPSVSLCSNIPRGTKIKKWFNVHPEAAASGSSSERTKKRWFVGKSYNWI